MHPSLFGSHDKECHEVFDHRTAARQALFLSTVPPERFKIWVVVSPI
jgi:hypothetical protein